ncbi:uncharacterized protein E6C27_scaffold157G00530 [Cucumis melo var. makuwa]|uniref:Reverse transcriptase/retrotransposon-derived protein RNase H-like domain-containing protein n=1 Tax=Cucumis melo var. makuwa TaxID=1194695 RepID=A0A5A7TSJ2_CUCMM|nr:uncharacterized protein E6C27_scaffold157G00530 [Cucumis melo var. makuwa]
MEQYFKASGTNSEETKATLAFMRLFDDAKLWWRSKMNDVQNDNHRNSNTPEPSEKGLKAWAKTKLYEQKVQDLSSALAIVERLFNYGGDQGSQKKNVTILNLKNMISKPNPPRNFTNEKKPQTSSSSTLQGAHQSNLSQTRPISCFLCKGPHWVAKCSHRGSLIASKASLQCSNNLKAKIEGKREDEGDTPRMGALKFLLAIQKNASHQKDAFEKGLMFVDAVINSKTAKSTMVDLGATHNFISKKEAHRLKLKIEDTFLTFKNTRSILGDNERGSVLGLVDVSKPFVIETDASDFSLRSVLTQEGHPIAYESRKLNSAERRYTVSKK